MAFEQIDHVSQLLSHNELIIKAIKSMCNTNITYFDFAIIFDKVDIEKWKQINVSRDLAVWIHIFS